MYTVGEVSKISGVSIKTLHHYQKVGLLEPARVGENNYRYYEQKEINRLQSILFYRELQISLDEIKMLLDEDEKYSRVDVLRNHLELIQERQAELDDVIITLTATLNREEELLEMEAKKSPKEMLTKDEQLEQEQEKFKGFKAKDDIMLASSAYTVMMAKPNALVGIFLCGIMLAIGLYCLFSGISSLDRTFFSWAQVSERGTIFFLGIGLTIYGLIGLIAEIRVFFFMPTKELMDDVFNVRYRTQSKNQEIEEEEDVPDR